MIPFSIGDDLANGEFWKVLGESFGQSMPLVFVIGVMASAVLLAIWINSQSIVLTAITAMLSGGVIVEFLPPEVRVAGYLLILFGVAAVGSSIYLGKQRKVR